MEHATVLDPAFERESHVCFPGDETKFHTPLPPLITHTPPLQLDVADVAHLVNDDRLFVAGLVASVSEISRFPIRRRTLDRYIGYLESRVVGGVSEINDDRANFDLHAVDDFLGEAVLGGRV